MTQNTTHQQNIKDDRALRRDIHLMSWLLGRLVREHGEEQDWQTLHQLREISLQRKDDAASADQKIADALSKLSVEEHMTLTRAIGMYFDLVNLAEDRHRVRVLRQREVSHNQSETIKNAASSLRQTGMDNAQLQQLIDNLNIEPVFTAHPTEAKRRSLRRSLMRLRQDLYVLDQENLTSEERHRQLLSRNRRTRETGSAPSPSPGPKGGGHGRRAAGPGGAGHAGRPRCDTG